MTNGLEQDEINLRLAAFRFDVTPPLGHSLCGGWIEPAVGVDDPLEAIGVVLLGAGNKPIVLCAVDWTGILNDAHVAWRAALAEAAGTSPDRVAVHCVHQHAAPMACIHSERIVAAQGDLPHIVDMAFHDRCLRRARQAIEDALPKAVRITHVARGQAKVDRVASNRRIYRDASGRIIADRTSDGPNEQMRAMPEGLIDPWLKTVAFYDADGRKVAALHYYATHPMSYYRDGRVSSDFAGLARKRRQLDEPDCLHVYFTGCAGNIAAGKYNDGTAESRRALADRMYDGIVRSEEDLQPMPIREVAWNTAEVLPPPNRALLVADELERWIGDRSNSVVARNRSAYMLSWLRRAERGGPPLVLSALHVNNISLLHLPGECFVEYQLRAQRSRLTRFVATAAYGDGGPWYIPVPEEYAHGGYEASVAFCDPQVDALLTSAMETLLT
jgi:hypothetical protein